MRSPRAEAAVAQLRRPGRPGSSARVGLPISAFLTPPRSNTRSTLPGCVTSQRGSGSRNGSQPFVPRLFRRRRRERLQPLRRAVGRVALAVARVLVRRAAVVVERRLPQHRARASSCWCGRCCTSAAWHAPQVLSATRRSPGLTNWMYSGDSSQPLGVGALGIRGGLPEIAARAAADAPSASPRWYAVGVQPPAPPPPTPSDRRRGTSRSRASRCRTDASSLRRSWCGR